MMAGYERTSSGKCTQKSGVMAQLVTKWRKKIKKISSGRRHNGPKCLYAMFMRNKPGTCLY